MNWINWLQLPAVVLLALAAVVLLLLLLQAFRMRRCLRDRRHLAAGIHGLLALVALALVLVLAGTAMALRGYRFLAGEQQVATLDARAVAPQRWRVALGLPDGAVREEILAGDEFRIEAAVLKWKLPAVLAGLPPLYRLDRLEGRYADAEQEAEAARTVIPLGRDHGFDLVDPRGRLARWLPEVDTVFGSGAYLPLVDDGHYTVTLMRTGALVARPDAATAARIKQPIAD